MAAPITLNRTDGSTQDITFSTCTPTFQQDLQIASIQFNAMATCLLYNDNACQSTPVTTLEPIMFNAGSNIRNVDSGELVAKYFTCSPGQ
ncbi:unnamed protein product [Absidia cylindrospora]